MVVPCASLPLLFHCQAIAGCLPGEPFRPRKGAQPQGGPGAARPTSRSALGAGCKPVFGANPPLGGPRFAGGSRREAVGCPVPWHASSVEVAHRPGLGSGFFLLVFSCFSCFFARARTPRKPAWIKAFRRFWSYPNPVFFPVIPDIFPVCLTFFRCYPQS